MNQDTRNAEKSMNPGSDSIPGFSAPTAGFEAKTGFETITGFETKTGFETLIEMDARVGES